MDYEIKSIAVAMIKKLNYLIQALLDKGLIKVNNLRTSDNKLNYLYLLILRYRDKKQVDTIISSTQV